VASINSGVLRMTLMVVALRQRLNSHQWLMSTSPRPVVFQLGVVRSGPPDDKTPRTRWQLTGDDGQALNVDGGLCLAIAGMKMRTTPMVDLVVVHPDRDPVEATDSRHLAILNLPPLRNKT
jgi:hypothetical protein